MADLPPDYSRGQGGKPMNNIHDLHPPAPVYEIMDRLGIDVAGGALPQFGLLFSCALRTCQHCRHGIECRDWLRGAPKVLDVAPAFCPIADIMFQLQYDGLPMRSACMTH
jgi:hypothetical protein